MPLAAADAVSCFPAGVVNPLFLYGVPGSPPSGGWGKLARWAGVEERGGRGPEAFPWAATFVAALFTSRRGGA
jgi:hypothetical protein